jgi:hypothetical protein
MNGDPSAIEYLGFDPRSSGTSMQDDFNFINQEMEHTAAMDSIAAIKNNPMGMKAASGLMKNSIGTALSNPLTWSNGLAGIMGGLGSAPAIAKQRMEVTGALTSLVNTGTFAKLMELKANGSTVGQLTEAERIAIGRAATELFAVMDVDDSGLVTGVNTSEERFQTLLNNYEAEQRAKQAQRATLYSGLTPDDGDFINNLPTFNLTNPLSTPMSSY